MHEVVGIDGGVNLGALGRVHYEVGSSRQTGPTVDASGVGARLWAETRLTDGLTWSFSGQRIVGVLRPPGREPLREGTALKATLDYRWSDTTRLVYEKALAQHETQTVEHSDTLRLESALGERNARWVAGIESKGADVPEHEATQPGSCRTWLVVGRSVAT